MVNKLHNCNNISLYIKTYRNSEILINVLEGMQPLRIMLLGSLSALSNSFLNTNNNNNK